MTTVLSLTIEYFHDGAEMNSVFTKWRGFLIYGLFGWCIADMSHASTVTGPYQISSVLVGGYGLHVAVSPAVPGCSADWMGTQLVVLATQSNYKDLVAGLLAAQAQNRQLWVWYDPQGSGTCGFGNQQIVNTIQIK